MSTKARNRVVLTTFIVSAAVVILAYTAWFLRRTAQTIHSDAPVASAPIDPGEVRFLKGQTHAHSGNSEDSRTSPSEVVRWYGEHGFDFVVFTDHNYVTRVASSSKVLAIPGVEITQNLPTCTPPPPSGMHCLLHVNALFVDPSRDEPKLNTVASDSRLDRFTLALDITKALDGLAQINHPNFQYSANARLLEELGRRGAGFLEIANNAVDSNNGGDATHPSTEALWDAVLTQGAHMWGIASDDAHFYYDAPDAAARGETVFTGDRGFVMVRARKDIASIRAAMAKGDFYSTSGVLLAKVEAGPASIAVEAAPEQPGELSFRLIGEGGHVLQQKSGRSAAFELHGLQSRYVRVDATDQAGRRAWLQPVWLR